MYIYLPIAEQPIHSLAILGIGAFLGLIMGLVGVGGGFLLTPLMMFLGIPLLWCSRGEPVGCSFGFRCFVSLEKK